MSTMSEIYITMKDLQKHNFPIDEWLKQAIAKLEEYLICNEILPEMYVPNVFNNYSTEI